MVSDKKFIKKHTAAANAIIAQSKDYQSYSDAELSAKTKEFQEKITAGASLDDILIDSYAVAREAARRLTGLEIYLVQIIGAIVLHEGDIAEMRTGEGKTITSLLPAYLNGMTHKGVHIITVNEYLAERDSIYIGEILTFLGLTVGLNKRDLSRENKQAAFNADVTYTTNSELGFDYLRDNMVRNHTNQVLRKLNYTIIDEADSILIDEARTPLIISGGRKASVPRYEAADQFAKSLVEKDDIKIDKETRQVFLTPSGVAKAEKFFSLKSLFNASNTTIYHAILNGLKANFVFKNGVEYLVKDGEIILIDQHTGRLMEGRSYSDGLQQAIQAKEHVKIEDETVTMATITYQNFFRLYNKLSGMTGTAKTEEEEFIKIYNTRVIQIPTNKPVIRKDEPDYVFANRHAKLKYLMEDIKKLNERGQPILIGTTSVESSEIVARYLDKANFKYEMLNAKNHRRKADIIAQAGQKSAITLATNMAGRGTDIKLGEGIANIGGLAVLGVERNEARRIDNQLRGRSGRQGDPGFSRLYVAVDDNLLIRFGAKKLQNLFARLGDDYLQSRMLSHRITVAQKRVEGMNFDQRKNVLDYDNVLAQHREAIYSQRNQILRDSNLRAIIRRMQYTCAYDLTDMFSYTLHGETFVKNEELLASIENKIIFTGVLDAAELKNVNRTKMARLIADEIEGFFEYRVSEVPEDVLLPITRNIIIQAMDRYWQNHIDSTQKLRTGIYLRSYAQRNPLYAYVQESAEMYRFMKIQIAHQVINALAEVVIRASDAPLLQDEEQVQVKMKG